MCLLQYAVDCDRVGSLPNIGFNITGKPFELPSDQYIVKVSVYILCAYTYLICQILNTHTIFSLQTMDLQVVVLVSCHLIEMACGYWEICSSVFTTPSLMWETSELALLQLNIERQTVTGSSKDLCVCVCVCVCSSYQNFG